jgi:hypothetical protein
MRSTGDDSPSNSHSNSILLKESQTWGHNKWLFWPNPGLLQDYLRIQTADLIISANEFQPGRPAWHYLSERINISVGVTRSGVEHFEMMERSEDLHSVHLEWFILASRIRQNRKMFRTVGGRFGLCPSWAEPRDLLCLLDGAPVPYFLRRQASFFQLVGEAYCHRVLNNTESRGDRPVGTFVLI